MRRKLLTLLAAAAFACGTAAAKKQSKSAESPLDRYLREAGDAPAQQQAAPGAIWSPGARLADGAVDPRASRVDDVLTVLVVEQASALATGTTKTSRASSAKNSVAALAGLTKAAGPLANLANMSGATDLQGQGTTSRGTTMNTTMTARITRVLGNGAMLVEGSKDVQVNSERQVVTVRGIARPADVGPGNVVRSDRLAQLEIQVNGKGVVGDVVRRPFILYRVLMGLLPF
jgi:flagellar L-ring protein FlgH